MFRSVGGKRRYLQLGVHLLLFAALAQVGWQVRNQASSSATTGMRPMGVSGGVSAASGNVVEAPVVNAGNGTLVGHSVKNDVSPALRDIAPQPAAPWHTVREMPEPRGENAGRVDNAAPVNDPVVQKSFGTGALAMPAPILNFAGVGNRNGVYPPDTNGDVGPNHYVQWVNLSLQIWNKSGVSVYGPVNGNTLWSGFGGPCQTQNAGDPIVLYDQIADRWVLSQFTSSSPYGECIAVSTTGDPTGSYYRYFFQHSTSVFYDYPHMGVWPDGYYTGFNRFTQLYLGPSAIVYDRAKMLLGQPATYQEKQLSSSYGTLQPADVDGSTMPSVGSPNFLVSRGSSALNFFKFQVDWAVPANSTITVSSVPVAAYNQLCSGTRNCIPQPSTTVGLDGIGDRVLHRLAYRNFGTHESLVINHSVDVDSTSAIRAGVRWYELRNPNSSPTIHQQGTYSPDATNRWMGSIAQDAQGNMALGYSVSSSSIYPGIRYTGRLVSDPLGQMAQGETTLINGSGSQTGTGYRWGDYSMMTVDPVDDCTFWYTTEYLASTGTAPWLTRIGSFKFPGCGGPPPTPTNTPVPVATNTPTPVPPTATNTPVPPPTNTPNPSADFTISVAPSSRTITRGQATTYTVTINSLNGFTGNVSLSVSGLPNRTTATFSPNPVSGGSGTSTLTVDTHKRTTTGSYPLTITGTSGSLSHGTTATLVVNP